MAASSITTPIVVTIYVRHSAGCKHEGNDYARQCKCRKHLLWFENGIRHRTTATTRSWAEAEEVKRDLEDKLNGRVSEQTPSEGTTLSKAIDSFLAEKRVQGITLAAILTYQRELKRLLTYANRQDVHSVAGVTRELLTGWMATWPTIYPSSVTRSKARERVRSFLRFCYESQMIPRIPTMAKIKVEQVPTLPLTAAEFQHLVDSIPAGLPTDGKTVEQQRQVERKRVRVKSLFLLMRYSGLAIRDAVSLRRSDIMRVNANVYRVVTSRQKTGVHVSVPIPAAIAEEVLATPNDNADFIFWSGNSDAGNHTTKWQTRYILPVFVAAGLNQGTMVSHRLRDTFAVDLLQKGVPLEEVSKLLGHTSIKTTEKHYAAWVQGRQDRLDSLVMATWEPVMKPVTPGRRRAA